MSGASEDVPVWLMHLEKPKPHTLGHEFGFGALCCACAFCSGLQLHFWRKTCMSCGCRLEDHDVDQFGYPQYQIIFGENKLWKGPRFIRFEGQETSFDWLPHLEDQEIIEEYMKNLPEERRPISGTAGSDYRLKQLGRQLPRYDVDRSIFPLSTDQEIADFEAYRNRLQADAAGLGSVTKLGGGYGIFRAKPALVFEYPESEIVQNQPLQFASEFPVKTNVEQCKNCDVPFAANSVVVSVQKLQDAFWHGNCFTCTVCGELLVDLHYFIHDGKVFCGRDYANAVKKPRCFACDEIIFEKQYASANGKFYHTRHFCCVVCDVSLGGEQYMQKNGNIICLPCYQQRYPQKCRGCGGTISLLEQRFNVCGNVYHKNEKCFRCNTCNKPIGINRIFCSKSNVFCELCFRLE